MTAMLKKCSETDWYCKYEVHKTNFEDHKYALDKPPIFTFLKQGLKYMIDMGASSYLIGETILKPQEETSQNTWYTLVF